MLKIEGLFKVGIEVSVDGRTANLDCSVIPYEVQSNSMFAASILHNGFGFRVTREPNENQRKKICRARNAVYLLLSNGLELLVLDQPIAIPLKLFQGSFEDVVQRKGYGMVVNSDDLWSLGYDSESDYIFYPQDQGKTKKKKGSAPISTVIVGRTSAGQTVKYSNAPPRISLGNEFVRKEVSYDYSHLMTLNKGDLLDSSPMEWAHSSALKALGFPNDNAGKNCLTNYDLVIPLVKPHNWNELIFTPIRGLRSVGQKLWSTYLAFLYGKYVSQIEEESEWMPLDSNTKESEDVSLASTQDPKELELGECYSSSYKFIRIVGRYIIFVRDVKGKPIEILDSPFSDVAVRGFPKGQAIKYLQADSKEKRNMADLTRHFRFYHTGDWPERVESALRSL